MTLAYHFFICFKTVSSLIRGGRYRLLLGLVLVVMFCGISARAEIWNVTDTSDSATDSGSLRYAVNHAAPGDNISILLTGTITLGSTLSLSSNVTIAGSGSTTISGNHQAPVFTMASTSGTTSIIGVTIANGYGPGGGIYSAGGALSLYLCTFSGNTASGNGGAIYNAGGSMTVINTTFAGNEASGSGGAIYSAGGSMTVINSTFSSNTASGNGGAIYSASGTVTVVNSTVFGNTAGSGGGIFSGGTLTVNNNIFSDNIAANGGGIDSVGQSAGSFNVFWKNLANGSEDDSTGYSTGNPIVGDPILLPLNNYGQGGLTMLPAPGSAAICAGSYALASNGGTPLMTDERLFPLAAANCDNGGVDAGAVQANYLVITNNNDSGAGSLRALLMDGVYFDIEFSPALFNAASTQAATTITLASELSLLGVQVNLIGPGMMPGGSAASATISGNNATEVFGLASSSTFIGGITIANGKGGVVLQDNNFLTVSNSIFSGNSVSGGIQDGSSNNVTSVTNSTFLNNTASGDGGAIYNSGALTVSDSTFSGNTALAVANGTFSYSGMGGAIYNYYTGRVTVSDSTFSGNTATSSTSGSAAEGGAIYSTGSTADLIFLTVNNSVFSGNVASGAGSAGGGIFNDGTNSAEVTGSYNLFYGNTANGSEDDSTGYGTSNYVTTAEVPLSALSYYGGPTPTMLPLPGAGAICAGSLANIPSGATTDQRGFPNTNITYTGYSATTPCMDAGAVQTDYTAIQFVASGYTGIVGKAVSPAPVVTATESGQTLGIPLTLSFAGTPSTATASGLGSTSVTASGTGAGATFGSLVVSVPGSYTLSTATNTSETTLNLTALSVTPAAALSASTASLNVGTVRFSITAPGATTAGTAFSFTVTALDTNNNPVSSYNGTVHFSSSDGAAVLPVNAALVNGAGTFTAKLITAGTQTIMVTDTANAAIAGSSAVTVSAAVVAHFNVSATATALAGVPFSITVVAQDPYGNTANGYTGTVHFSSMDGAAILPANAALVNGAGTFTAKLITAGTQTITATDTTNVAITGSGTITVSMVVATHFNVSAPATVSVGAPFSFTVIAQNASGNTAIGYNGTVHFSSTDGAAVLPANAALTGGMGTFTISLNTLGSRTVTVTDPVTAIAGTSNAIAVYALNYVVTSAGDDSPTVATATANCAGSTNTTCTLRDAVTLVNTQTLPTGVSGNVSFAPALTANATTTNPTIITLTSNTVLELKSNVIITGPNNGANSNVLSISGNNQTTVFQIDPTVTAGISGLMITAGHMTGSTGTPGIPIDPGAPAEGGPGGDGVGGILNNGTLTLTNSIVSNNTGTGGTGGAGVIGNSGGGEGAGGNGSGGILNNGALTLTNSTVSNNSGTGGSGDFNTGFGGNAGGGILNNRTLTLTNSTVSNNGGSATYEANSTAAGGILNNGTMTLTNDTVSTNGGGGNPLIGAGGGIYNAGTSVIEYSTISGNLVSLNADSSYGAHGICNVGTLTLIGSIVAGSNGTNDISDLNLDSSSLTSASSNNEINLTAAQILLAPLGNYGGSTQTMLPLPGSPAICAGTITGDPATDQRGVAHPATGYSTNPCVDAGAVQTAYSLSFTQQPSTVAAGVTFSPAVAVQLSENGQMFDQLSYPALTANGAIFPKVSISMAATAGTLDSAVSKALVDGTSGVATFTGLGFTSATPMESDDVLTASLGLDMMTAATATSSSFHVMPALPVVTQVVPNSGVVTGGTAVTLTGTSFINVQGVAFGSVAATSYTVNSATRIAAIAPPGTGPGAVNVTVTTASGTSAGATANQFTYVLPVIKLTPASLPTGTYGTAYSQTIAASGGVGPYSYAITAGALPSGLSLTTGGLLSGTPMAVGSYSFTITATDSNKYTCNQTYTLSIGKVTLALTANNTARVFGAANPSFTGTATGAVNGDVFTGSFSTTATPASIVGGYPIVPSVSGANLANYTVVVTNGVLTISQAGTATTFALSGNNLTMTATVASLTSGVPTGTVSFYQGQTLVGTGTLSGGTASYTTSSFPIGDIVVSAQYSGDSNFTESASPPILVLSLLPTLTSLSVGQAGSVTDKVNLSSVPGFSGTVQFSCTNLPQNSLCSFQPSSVTFPVSGSTASVMVTIQTGTSTQGLLAPLHPGMSQRNVYALAALWMPGLFALMAARRGRKRKSPFYKLMVVLMLFGIGTSLIACGGSPSSTGSGSTTQTPMGTSTVQVVVTGPNGLSQTTGLTLTVQ
ncbi:MAG TPA: choice-of-anchor Q domain-containing protein [Granulicella sp.]